MRNVRKGCVPAMRRTGEKALEYDNFAKQFQFMLPERKDRLGSLSGCTCTLIWIFSCLFYGILQSIKLFTFDETDIMVSSVDAHYDSNFVYSDNLMFAFGITAYDSNPDPIEDPSYGVMKAYKKRWGFGGGSEIWELPTRDCTDAELHVNGQSDPNSLFFKPHKNSVKDLAFYSKKFKCLQTDKIELQGDYNSAKAQVIAIQFEMCDNSTYTGGICKSDEEITEWMRRKFILINQNQERFSAREYQPAKKITYETRLDYVLLNTQVREDVIYFTKLTELEL